jgi:hypothetical protein
MENKRRASQCDVAARRRLTIKRDDAAELVDATPIRVENKYPILHARTRDLDDLLLQEIYLLMFRQCEVTASPYSAWMHVPLVVSLFHLSSSSVSPPRRDANSDGQMATVGPSLVGGMLFAGGEFLFGEMPFVRNRVKDVRCRLEFDAMEGGLEWLSTVPQPPRQVIRPRHQDDGDASTALTSMDVAERLLGGCSADVLSTEWREGTNGDAAVLLTQEEDVDVGKGGERLSPSQRSISVAPTDSVVVVPQPPTAALLASASLNGGGGRRVSAAPVPTHKLLAASGMRLPSNVIVSGNGIATCRAHFRVEEFECGAMSWIVQRFQLVEPNNNIVYGPVFARAFQPFDASGGGSPHRVRRLGAPLPPVTGRGEAAGRGDTAASPPPGGSSSNGETFASSQFGVGMEMEEMRRAKRKALPGEERLRILKPTLYQWCLDRSPTEMGAAATVLKELLLYYRHTFSVVRTVRVLMRAVRRIQTACRRMLERRRNTTVRMITEWTCLELEVQSQLGAYVPVLNDPVDAAVYQALKNSIITTDAFKMTVMMDMYDARQLERLSLPPEQRGNVLLRARYRFYIPPAELLAESHRRLVESLCRTDDSPIFKDPRIRDILRDRTEEILQAKAQRERVDQRRREAARTMGTFGTTPRATGQWEHPSVVGRRETRRNAPSRRKNMSPTGLRGGVVLSPSPPSQLGSGGKFSNASFSGSVAALTASPRRRPHPRGGGGRQPRPQHLAVIDAMFDDV